ncbi:hypothetical protein LCGC14_0814070 [marine sediment metagenome]|uniref:Nucleoside 2-deoxyribosyltransferase n=1 Tax=marine sediment metagenome TaxID=412755 RepID=A0A0F9PQD4_9ZZZZ
MKTLPVVYLAGPMAGCTYDEADGWRQYVRNLLPECDVRSPMRGKNFLQDLKTIPTGIGVQSHELAVNAVDAAISSPHAIVIRDHADVTEADAVIVNLSKATSVSIGTCFELAWCWEQQKPAVVVMPKDSPHEHPFIREAAYAVVPSINDAVMVARTYLNLEVYAE